MRKIMNAVSKSFLLMAVLLVTALNGFGQNMHKMAMKSEVQKAVCILYPTAGNNVSGVITFTQTPDGILVSGDVKGLTPGKHGFHIHECGDCTAADGTSAGGHFNPTHMPHGAPTDAKRHVGDMGNIVADASGKAHVEYVDKVIQLNGPLSILGRGIIVHQGADDFVTQPTGNAGSRVACGVIGVAKK
ncbi:MAG TPA: superoxide dismutase family protein [Williamwhitmania sp.]|nr:superoxide dismutase family protein [Williamwhitmania sp.]